MADPIGEMFIRVLPDTKAFAPAVAAQTGAATSKAIGGISAVGKVGLAATVAVGAGLFKMGSEADAAFDSIKVATGATGDALKVLEDDAKAVASSIPVSFQSAADAIGIINTDLGLSGEQGQAAAESILEASRLLGEDGVANTQRLTRALKQWGVEADSIPIFMDTAFAATQKYGVSLESLSGNLTTYGSILNNAGFNTQEAIEFFGQLEQSGINVSRVMPALNKAMRDWAEEGITDVQGELTKTVDEIANAETEMEALQIATEVFGAQGAQRFSQAIRDGNFSLDQLGEALGDTAGSIEDTADDTDSAAEAFQKMKNRIFLAIEPAATKFFKSLGETVEALAPAIEGVVMAIVPLLEIFAAIPAPLQAIILGGLAFAAVASKLAPAITGVIKVFKLLSLALAANPWLLLIAAVVGLVIVIVKNWDKIKEFVGDALEKIGEFIEGFVDTVTDIWDGFVEAVRPVMEAVVGFFQEGWDFVKGVFDAVIGFFQEWWRLLIIIFLGPLGIIINLIIVHWETIKDVTETVFNAIIDFLQAGWEILKGIFQTAMDVITGIITTAWSIIQTVIDTAMTIINGVITAGMALWRSVIEPGLNILRTIFETVWGAITAAVELAKNLITGFLDLILAPIGGIQGAIETLGSIWDTVWNGISDVIGRVAGTIIDTINRIKDAASDALGPLGTVLDAGGSVLGGVFNAGKTLIGKAAGGTVSANEPFLVGERGPELFVPGRTGQIIRNDQVGAALSGPQGGAGGLTVQGPLLSITGNVNVRNEQDITKLSRRLADDARRVYRAEGRQTSP